jgi:hypothetical protein
MTNDNITSTWDLFDSRTSRLLDALAEALHAMAQPLTVLRATLELALGNSSSIAAGQSAMEASLGEVERVVENMGFAQELLRIMRDRPVVASVDVQAILATVREDLQRVMDEAGIALVTSIDNDASVVLASASGLRQCAFLLLQQPLHESAWGDSITVNGYVRRGEVEMVVRCESSSRKNSPSPSIALHSNVSEIRGMVLAQALAVAQGGDLRWHDSPFEACLSLPIGRSGIVETENLVAVNDRSLTAMPDSDCVLLGANRA